MCCRCPETTQLNVAPPGIPAAAQSFAYTIVYMFTQKMPDEGMSSVQIDDALQAGQVPALPDSLPCDLQRMLRQCFTWPCTQSTAALLVMKL